MISKLTHANKQEKIRKKKKVGLQLNAAVQIWWFKAKSAVSFKVHATTRSLQNTRTAVFYCKLKKSDRRGGRHTENLLIYTFLLSGFSNF